MPAMREMPDKAFDLAIVDPPYGIGKFTCDAHTDGRTGRRIKNVKPYKDDYTWNDSIPQEIYFHEVRRITKEQIIWGANYYNCFVDGGALVWYKGPMTETISHCEIASLSQQKRVSFVRIDWQSGFYRTNKEGEQIHPCQKPVALYKWLLKNYAKPGDRILDTHLGSGSIAIACHDMGHDLTAYEIDAEYHTAAVKRFENHIKQGRLF
jgi:site-specific DNA-methyltransferase (adenine-specific)